MADDVKTNEDELGMNGEHAEDAGGGREDGTEVRPPDVNGYHASAEDEDDELLVADGTASEAEWDEASDDDDEDSDDDDYRWSEDSDERGLFDESELDATDAGEDDEDLDADRRVIASDDEDDEDDEDFEDDDEDDFEDEDDFDDEDDEDDDDDEDEDDFDADEEEDDFVASREGDNAAVSAADEPPVPANEATADEATADEATADEATADEATADEATADESPAEEAPTEDVAAAGANNTGETEASAPQRVSDPGAQHALLAALEGTWDTVTKVWIAPSVPELELRGEAERTWLFEGRFLKEERSTHVPEGDGSERDADSATLAASEDTASEDTASEDTASEDTASEDTASEDTTEAYLDAERPDAAAFESAEDEGADARGRGRQRGRRRGRDRDRGRDKAQVLMRSAPRGLAFWGHDNATGRFQGTFMSNNSTAQVHFAGTADEATQTIVFMGAEPDPSGRGPTRNFKLVLTIDDDSSHRLTQYYVQRNGRELQSFEIAYTRRTMSA